MSACSHKEKIPNKKNVFTIDSTKTNATQCMQESKNIQTVQLKGKNYHISLSRTPNKSLPHVKTQSGEPFLDNEITLKITKDDGSVVINKTFTKSSFASYVPDDFLPNAILEGMAFDKVVSDKLYFGASLCYPETDLYFPLIITITSDGSVSIAKGELMEENYPEDKE